MSDEGFVARTHLAGADEVEGIPVIWVEPDGAATGTVLWLTHLGGSTEQTQPMLARLADRGLLALSFDPPGHGRRSSASPREVAGRMLAAFRRRMWPFLGDTTLECLRVLDWADERFAIHGPHVAGGVSMGGDVAVALAGIDPRISRVSALIATPDWTRPGMHTLDDPPQLLDQGAADAYARWFFDGLNPITHLHRYDRDVAIDFQCGDADTHVPAEAAIRFRAALLRRNPDAVDRVRVDLHPGLTHLAAARRQTLYERALDWLSRDVPARAAAGNRSASRERGAR